jgi:hypothetical protein
MESSFHSLIHSLPLFCSSQTHTPAGWSLETWLFSTRLLFASSECPFIPRRHGPRRKPASIAKEPCLLIRCLAMDVLLLRALAPAGMCLPSRCLAVGTMSQYIFVCLGVRQFINFFCKWTLRKDYTFRFRTMQFFLILFYCPYGILASILSVKYILFSPFLSPWLQKCIPLCLSICLYVWMYVRLACSLAAVWPDCIDIWYKIIYPSCISAGYVYI